MSDNPVATLASIQDRIKERIQSTFMDFLPPELFEQMVSKAVAEFQEKELKPLIYAAIKDRIAEQVQAEFKKPEYAEGIWTTAHSVDGVFINGKPGPSLIVAEIVKQAAPELMNAIFGSYIQQMVMALRNGQIRPY